MTPFCTRNSVYFLITFMTLQAMTFILGIFLVLREVGSEHQSEENLFPFMLWSGFRIPYFIAYLIFAFLQLASIGFGIIGRRYRILWVLRIYMASLWLGIPFLGCLFIHLSATAARLPYRFVGPDCFFYGVQYGVATPMAHISCSWNRTDSAAIELIFESFNCTEGVCNDPSVKPAPDSFDIETFVENAAARQLHIITAFVMLGAILPLFIFSPLIYLTHVFAQRLSNKGMTIQLQLDTAPFAGNLETRRVAMEEGQTSFLESGAAASGLTGGQSDPVLRKLGL